MSRLKTPATLGLVFALAAAAAAFAQPAAPPPPPTKDPNAAPAGTYKMDVAHESIVARVGHGGGFSFSTVRFGVTEATLNWDPAHIENSKVNVTISAQPHYDPIKYNVGPETPMFLNVAAFPTATFVSTSVKRTGPSSGQIMGNFTLMGKTQPITIDAQLVGAGKNGRGQPIIGFTGTAKIKRADFGLTALPNAIAPEVELVIDAEFDGAAS